VTGLTVLDFDVGDPRFGKIYWADGAAKCKQHIRVLGSAESVTTGETVALSAPLCFDPPVWPVASGGLQF
jgi:hypothetical protein